MLRTFDEDLEELDRRLFPTHVNYIDVDIESVKLVPKREEQIQAYWKDLELKSQKEDADAKKREDTDEMRRKELLEEEGDAKEFSMGFGPNPAIDDVGGVVNYYFTTGKLPKKVESYGVVDFSGQPDGNFALTVHLESYLALPLDFFSSMTLSLGMAQLNYYTICLSVKLQRPTKSNRVSLFRTFKPTDRLQMGAEFSANSDGSVGCGAFADASSGNNVQWEKWNHVAFAVDAESGTVSSYVNGGLALQWGDFGPAMSGQGGPLSLHLDHEEGGAFIFASQEEEAMAGGMLRLVSIHNRILMEDEIMVLYESEKASFSFICEVCMCAVDATQSSCTVCGSPRPPLPTDAPVNIRKIPTSSSTGLSRSETLYRRLIEFQPGASREVFDTYLIEAEQWAKANLAGGEGTDEQLLEYIMEMMMGGGETYGDVAM